MAQVAFDSVVLADGVWTFSWSYAGDVRIVLWGTLLEETDAQEYQYAGGRQHSSTTVAPPLEVMPAGEEAPSETNLPYLVLQWYRVAGAITYVIEYKDGADWVVYTTLPDNPAVWVNTFITPLLTDQAESRWRVTVLDDNKRESTPMQFYADIVRPPAVPTGTALACTGGTLTVSEG